MPDTDSAFLATLLTAAQLPPTFTLPDLAVACWRQDPARFGLDGYSDDHPDARKVSTVLYGARGLIRLGLLELDAGRFRLTDFGRRKAEVYGPVVA